MSTARYNGSGMGSLDGLIAGGSTSAETLYVKKLNYTDSNEAEYMQAQSDTQIGAF